MTENKHSGSERYRSPMGIALAFTVLVMGLGLAAAELHAAPCEVPTRWVEIDDSSQLQWDVKPDPNSERLVHITPRGHRPLERPPILVLMSKKSRSYDVALTRILEDFAGRGLWFSFEVFYFSCDDGGELPYLKRAERGEYSLVFPMGSKATGYVAKGGFAEAPESSPYVSVCSKDPVRLGHLEDESGSHTAMAFTSLNLDMSVHLGYFKLLRPKLERVGVVYAGDNRSAVETQVKPLVEAGDDADIEIIKVEIQSGASAPMQLREKLEQTIAEIHALDPKFEHSLLWLAGSTAVLDQKAMISDIAGELPVLSVSPTLVDGTELGMALSIGVRFEQNAQIAASRAAKILNENENPGDMAVGKVEIPDISIDFRRARAMGLRIPFAFFEQAAFIYDYDGRLVRKDGVKNPTDAEAQQ